MPNVFRWLEDTITVASRFFVSQDLPDYCDLQTVVRLTDDDRIRHPELAAPYILVNDDGDYCSVYEVSGSFCDTDEDAAVDKPYSWAGRIERMTHALNPSSPRVRLIDSGVLVCVAETAGNFIDRAVITVVVDQNVRCSEFRMSNAIVIGQSNDGLQIAIIWQVLGDEEARGYGDRVFKPAEYVRHINHSWCR